MTLPEDEAMLRLMAFWSALLAISVRERLYFSMPAGVPYDQWGNPADSPIAKAEAEAHTNEARSIADAVVLEAQRLRAQGKPQP